MRLRRFAVFNLVGLAGIGVQIACLAFLTEIAGVHYLTATVAAVTISVVHNFLWHWLWTWRDRRGNLFTTFVRFALANGVVSLVGNLGVMATLVSGASVHPVAANGVAIAVCGLLNFWLGDSVVFVSAAGAVQGRRRSS